LTTRKPVRVRKARRSGTCPECRRLVLVGELIASVNGGAFICISHITRQHTDGPEPGHTQTTRLDGPGGQQ
jgi:hypothetical protein